LGLKGLKAKKYIGIKEKPEIMVQFYLKLVYYCTSSLKLMSLDFDCPGGNTSHFETIFNV